MTEKQQTSFNIEDKAVIYGTERAEFSRYPFKTMKVGQSFYLEGGFNTVSRVRAAASSYGKRNDMKFSIVRDGQGYRCGRIK